MVGTKSRGYSNSGRLSEDKYSVPFFSTRPSPSKIIAYNDLPFKISSLDIMFCLKSFSQLEL